MSRSTRIPVLCLLALASLALAGSAPAEERELPEFTVTPLTDRLVMLTGRGGNIAAWMGDDGIVLVDADFEVMHEKLTAALATRGSQPVRKVINTHWHFDHVEGNGALALRGATVIAHENVRKRMIPGQKIALLDYEIPPAPPAALPTMTFTDTLRVYADGEEILVFHPGHGHTDGDAVVHFVASNVIHMGDLFFNCGYPFIDISSGGTIDGMIAMCESALGRCDDGTRIIPGHGPLAARADLVTYIGMLRDFRSIVAREKSAGKSLKQILSEKPTASVDARFGEAMFSPEMFTEMVYRTLPPGR